MTTSEQHLQTIRVRGGDAFKTWLGAMLAENPNGLGSELVESTPGSDNVSAVDDALRAAEALGWIERTALAPSVSQQAFGGLQYASKIGDAPDYVKKHHASWFMWRIIDRETVETFVGDKKPAPEGYQIGEIVGWRPAHLRSIGMQNDKGMRKAEGKVVGFSSMTTRDGIRFPRVSWSDDPKDEVECVSTYFEESCGGYDRKTDSCPRHGRIPYAARAVSPAAIRRLG